MVEGPFGLVADARILVGQQRGNGRHRGHRPRACKRNAPAALRRVIGLASRSFSISFEISRSGCLDRYTVAVLAW